MCDILVNDIFDELREENNRLNNDLCYERQINKILENIKNYSIILKNNCNCGQNIDIFKKLNDLEIEYKLLKTKTYVKQTLNYKSVENNNLLNQSIKSDVNQNNCDIQMTSSSIITRSVNKTTENLSKIKEISVEPKTTPICNECQQIFDTELDSVLHVNRYHKNVESFICHECNQVFDSRDVFSMHLREHQTNEDKSQTTEGKSQTNSKPKFKTITDYLRSYRKPITTSTALGVCLTENKPKFNFMSDLLKPGTSSDGSDNSCVIPIEKIKVEPNSDSSQEFRCHSCLKGFECDDDLGVHVRESHPNLVCRQCNQWFYSKDDIFTHVSNFHKTPNQVFCCSFCNFSTTSKSSLDKHKDKNHFKSTKSRFKCDNEYCGNVFKTKSAIISHKKYCRKNFDENKKQVLVKPINSIFYCDFCDYKTEKNYNLQKHRKRQHFREPLVCDINGCGKTFNRNDSLRNHKKSFHRKAKQLNPIVFEKTTEKNVMEGIGQHPINEQTSEHINSYFGEEVKMEFISDSDNESNIKATELENYSFDFSNRLKSIFNNKKKGNVKQNEGFKCDFPNCGKILSRKDLVNRHKRRVHKQYSQRKGRVETKSSVIKKQNQLNTPFVGVSNESSNKPFACNIEGCRYSTDKKKNLSDHLRRTHKNGLKFVCNYPNCKRRFDSELILKQHMNCHKNRFVCRWSGCQFRTNTFAKLNEHKRIEKHLKTETESID